MSHTEWGGPVSSTAIDRDADVRVIGGGPAGTWAAAAAAGTGVWYVEPDWRPR
jgi:heterodisulfide reductase subunit A-like polyferredoxin